MLLRVCLAIMAMAAAAETPQRQYVTFQLERVMVMPPGAHQPIPVIVGTMSWGQFDIEVGIVNGAPAGKMTDGKKSYPLSKQESVALLMEFIEMSEYMKDSEKWFEGGGVYPGDPRASR